MNIFVVIKNDSSDGGATVLDVSYCLKKEEAEAAVKPAGGAS